MSADRPRLRKDQLLAMLAGTRCPICLAEKEAQRWTCYPCGEPWRLTAEARMLNRACDEHLEAARAFLGMIQTARGGGEPVD